MAYSKLILNFPLPCYLYQSVDSWKIQGSHPQMLPPPRKIRRLIKGFWNQPPFFRDSGMAFGGIYPQIRVHPIHPYPSEVPKWGNARPETPSFSAASPTAGNPTSVGWFFLNSTAAMTCGSGTKWKTLDSVQFFFGSGENCWKRRVYPAKCIKNNTNNSNVSWRILENSDKMLRLGSSVTICFGWFWHVLGWKYILRMWNVLWPQTVHQLFQAAPPRLKAEFPAF